MRKFHNCVNGCMECKFHDFVAEEDSDGFSACFVNGKADEYDGETVRLCPDYKPREGEK
jgi:hypothetical protein